MKKILVTFFMVCSMIFSTVAFAKVDSHDPYKMLTTVASSTFDTLKANKDKIKDVEYRKSLINSELMPYVDIKYASYKVIGNNLKSTTAQERDEFTEAFADYIVDAYASALGKYDNQELVMPEYKKVPDTESMINVKFLIREQGKQDLELVFKLRKNTKTGEWKVFDMIAENISMLSAKQSELSPLIRDKGIKTVTSMLKNKEIKETK